MALKQFFYASNAALLADHDMNRMCKSPYVLVDSFCIEVEGVIAVHDLAVVNEEPVPISSSNINAFERIQQV